MAKPDTLGKLNSFLNHKAPRLAYFLQRTWKNQQQAVTYKELREAIQAGQFDMNYLLQWQQDYSAFVSTYYTAIAQQAIDTATQELRMQFPILEDTMPSLMDNFIQTQGGRLIREVSQAQYTAVNTLVRQAALTSTMTVDHLARAIRPCIGLTQRQAQSAYNLYGDLIDQGIDPATAQKRMERYAEMSHRRRAASIAQTELAYAYNNGQQALVEESIKDGTIAPGATKIWYTAADERVCSQCGSMDMQEVPIDAAFSNGVKCPPAHPNCRCTIAFGNLKAPQFTQQLQVQPAPQPQQEDYEQVRQDTALRKEAGKKQKDLDGLSNTLSAKEQMHEYYRQGLTAGKYTEQELQRQTGYNFSAQEQKIQALRQQIDQAQKELDNIFDRAKITTKTGRKLFCSGVEYLPIQKHATPLSEAEIIKRIAGGDMTQGSCASVALAYAGQKKGYDVLDFRDGESRDFFSGKLTKMEMFKELGLTVLEESKFKSNLANAKRMIASFEEGKEYYFGAGAHAAIVRVTNGKPQYLELQTRYEWSNGWHNFDEWSRKPGDLDGRLKDRFGCSSSSKYYPKVYAVDISGLGGDQFEAILGFINTDESKQKKGATGSAK